ncbi:hypothetical protein HYALB_00005422 [Hymenoscyphus albidus]|uniref:Uncharacterized protein n=1 Tax=Hymenoscyphus albidus TaxID=595503 RepID=A0A9N9LH85_9HELO|nr:hypothetical protein HYALB_00005422 [Hymenoscyphus albidus]
MSFNDPFFDQFRHDKDPECLNRARFMNTPFPLPLAAMLFLSIVVICVTQYMRSITPGVTYIPFLNNVGRLSIKQYDPLATQNFLGNENEARYRESGEEEELHNEEGRPPPYHESLEPNTNSTQVKPTKPRSSAELFVIGTACLLVIIFCLVTIAFATQATIFCQDWSPLSVGLQVFFWFFYLIPLLTSTQAFGCWTMLLRDLWGLAARKKYPVSENWVFIPFGIIGRGVVMIVEKCQERLCGAGINGDDIEVIGLEDGPREDIIAENVGLMSGAGKRSRT